LVLLIVAAALALGGALVATSAFSSTDSSSGTREEGPVVGGERVAALLQGIPQHGAVLGSPRAPVTLVEYADIQCPYCAEWAREAFPVLVRDYVRPGRLRIEFRGLRFIGADSERGLRAAIVAGRRGRLWNVVDLLFLNQGTEGSGWVTDDLLGEIARAAGLDAQLLLGELDGPALEDAMQESELAAQQAGVRGTP
jgi:protein-disulfide isomerase